MLKEKSDGLYLGALKFPILFKDTIYLLPKDAGDKLVAEGYAKLATPKTVTTERFNDESAKS